MPQIQVLPSVPTFGSRLGEVLDQAASNLAAGYTKRRQTLLDQHILSELGRPDANRSPLQNIALASRASPELAKSLTQMYGGLAQEQEKGKQKLALEKEKGKIHAGQQAAFLQGPEAYAAYLAGQNVPQQPVDRGSPLNQPSPNPAEFTPDQIQDRQGVTLGSEAQAMPGMAGKQSLQGTPPAQAQWSDQQLASLVSDPTIGGTAKELLAGRRVDKKLAKQEALASYKITDKFREQVSNDFNNYQTEGARLDRLEELNNSDKLVGALPKKIMDALGVPLSVWGNPDSEEYEKLIADMTKSARDYYGARITNFELDAFLKTLPSLLNSKEGRTRIINNLKILKAPQKLRYDAYKEVMKQWKAEGNEGVPFDLRERIDQMVEPALSQLSSQFATDRKYIDPESGKAYNIPFDQQKNIPQTWQKIE